VKTILYTTILLVACGSDSTTDDPPDPVDDTDPLASITSEAEPGSLDDLHERIISQRCSGQPGLCHNGQFEPNLSTPGLAYAYLVNRPSIEKPTLLRVSPGDASESVLIDKLRNRDVATQMPLGADPLDGADIAAIEAWIEDGALRRPGDDPAPQLNEPPWKPEIGVFAANGTYTVIVTGTAASPVFTTLNDEFITPTSGSLPTPNATAIGRISARSYLTVPSGQANIVRLTNAGSGGTPQN
jgi:hypothetical protein